MLLSQLSYCLLGQTSRLDEDLERVGEGWELSLVIVNAMGLGGGRRVSWTGGEIAWQRLKPQGCSINQLIVYQNCGAVISLLAINEW